MEFSKFMTKTRHSHHNDLDGIALWSKKFNLGDGACSNKAIEQVKIHSVINLLLVRICTTSNSAHGARGGNNLMQTLSLSAYKANQHTHTHKQHTNTLGPVGLRARIHKSGGCLQRAPTQCRAARSAGSPVFWSSRV
jgi:hypothetical protein